MAIGSLILGLLGLPTAGIMGIGALLAVTFGIVALVKASKDPHEYGGKGMAIAGIAAGVISMVIFLVIAIIAAIAIPSLLQARLRANEAGTIGDIRTVISAEHAYASMNDGYFDTLECLEKPQKCIPQYAMNAPVFLDTELALSKTKMGYRRTFHAGPPPLEIDLARVSPSSMTAFAYVAEPVKHGNTGTRAFCGDSTGVLCQTTDGRMPMIAGGQCPPPDVCLPFQ